MPELKSDAERARDLGLDEVHCPLCGEFGTLTGVWTTTVSNKVLGKTLGEGACIVLAEDDDIDGDNAEFEGYYCEKCNDYVDLEPNDCNPISVVERHAERQKVAASVAKDADDCSSEELHAAVAIYRRLQLDGFERLL